MKHRHDLGDFAGFREALTGGLLILCVLGAWAVNPNFMGTLNFSFILTNSVEVGLIALVMTFLIVMGEIDISVGSIVGLSAAVLGQAITLGVPFALAALCALAAGALAGFINGILCVKLRLSSLVVTLATFVLFRGLAELIIDNRTVSEFPEWFLFWDQSRALWFISWPVVFWAVGAVAAVIILHRLRFGRHVFFIGGNPLAARYAGIQADRTRVLLLTTSGLVAAVVALILTSRLSTLDNTAGGGLEFVVITAVLLGGTDFRGGRGTILGTTMAVLLIAVLRNGLQMSGVSAQISTSIVGVLLIFSIALAAALVTFRRRARVKEADGLQKAELSRPSHV